MIYDISPVVSTRLAVWPGDTPLSREVLLDLGQGANITLSTLRATVHLGAHADAPSHYAKGGGTIDERSLGLYIGLCQVVTADVPRGGRVTAAMLPRGVNIAEKRVILRTNTYPDPERFNEDFAGLDPTLVDMFARRGVALIGIDTPSVDLHASKDLPAHAAFHRNDMAILEGLVLGGVPDGVYELIALPLRLEGFDASPVRAILRNLEDRGMKTQPRATHAGVEPPPPLA